MFKILQFLRLARPSAFLQYIFFCFYADWNRCIFAINSLLGRGQGKLTLP